MNRERLAILIPAFNAAAYLPRLFASIEAQTEKFDEILLYDDASTDATAEIARGLGANVISGISNKGCSYGKNALAEKTSCEWIHFHDADDALLPTFVSNAREWISKGDHDVVLFPYEEWEDESGQLCRIRRFDAVALEADAILFAIRHQINPFCGLYRRSRFLQAGGYDVDPEVLYNEDVAMHCQLARAGLKFSADSRVSIVNYRRTASMSSANPVKCARAQYHVMRKCAESGSREYSVDISRRLWNIAGVSASLVDWETADAAAGLATRLSGMSALTASAAFTALCKLNPAWALRVRELAIRVFKPGLRKGYPKLGRLQW